MRIKRICVFCGSSPGAHKDYALCAEKLGRLLAESKIELVYGGGSVGLMGVIASDKPLLPASSSITSTTSRSLDLCPSPASGIPGNNRARYPLPET